MPALALDHGRITEDDVAAALATFDPVWNALATRASRIVQLLVERVDYDGARGTVAITFHPAGLKALAAEQLTPTKEKRHEHSADHRSRFISAAAGAAARNS